MQGVDAEAEIRLLLITFADPDDVGHNQRKDASVSATSLQRRRRGKLRPSRRPSHSLHAAARLHFSQTPTSSCTPRRLSEHPRQVRDEGKHMKDFENKNQNQQQ